MMYNSLHTSDTRYTMSVYILKAATEAETGSTQSGLLKGHDPLSQ